MVTIYKVFKLRKKYYLATFNDEFSINRILLMNLLDGNFVTKRDVSKIEESEDIQYLYRKYGFDTRSFLLNHHRKFMTFNGGLLFIREYSDNLIIKTNNIIKADISYSILESSALSLKDFGIGLLPPNKSNEAKMNLAERILQGAEEYNSEIELCYSSIRDYIVLVEKFYQEVFKKISKVYIEDYKLEIGDKVFQIVEQINLV